MTGRFMFCRVGIPTSELPTSRQSGSPFPVACGFSGNYFHLEVIQIFLKLRIVA
jgi:hypothetical protein